LGLKIAAVGDNDTVTGLALAGTTYTHVHQTKDETLKKLGDFFASGEIGLVLITHRVADALGYELRQMMQTKKLLPIVLKIPDKTGYAPTTDELRDIIRRTVGAEIIVKREGE
jgi:vacuolar-type H+-ATPase subunit F/Vma7